MSDGPATTGATKAGATTGDDGQASETMSYEAARDELVQVVQKLETGGTTLEESLQLWERGEKLAGICQQWLDGARQRLAAASPQASG